jgi:hypothetical protein
MYKHINLLTHSEERRQIEDFWEKLLHKNV